MSNDLVRRTQSSIVKSEGGVSNAAGSVLLYGGGASLALMGAAFLLPFISLTMLMVALVVGGIPAGVLLKMK